MAESLEQAWELNQKGRNNIIIGGNLWLKMGKRNIIKGFPGAALENVEMSNVILRPGKNADEKVFQISSADGVMLDSIKIVGEDNAGERICFDNCKDAKVCNKF